MAKILEITKQIKSAIGLANINSEHLRHFTDKRTNGRRLKFFGIEPNESELEKLNKLFKLANIKAVASITKSNEKYMHYSTRMYSHNKLVVHVTN